MIQSLPTGTAFQTATLAKSSHTGHWRMQQAYGVHQGASFPSQNHKIFSASQQTLQVSRHCMLELVGRELRVREDQPLYLVVCSLPLSELLIYCFCCHSYIHFSISV